MEDVPGMVLDDILAAGKKFESGEYTAEQLIEAFGPSLLPLPPRLATPCVVCGAPSMYSIQMGCDFRHYCRPHIPLGE